MATTNLSAYDKSSMPDASKMKFAVICSEWNDKVTDALLKGACDTLMVNGVKEENIFVEYVPGTFELTFGAKRAMQFYRPDAVIVLGCVVRGGTPHFDYVCGGVTQGITSLNEEGTIPVIFGVLTTDDMQQALDRAGGSLGNKGDEAAVTAIKMAALSNKLK
ncbi:MAG: 6,7-dimethyl-8-ribityllumazine synthase [Bacteroidales bacterium]|nr:6,7-dimethyl-8-ribityllumazine synthase [Bacteroidales bacterium]MBQ7819365.1 6,7-dimethyl-8-ribityllumazine synthase [Bacteroidales bacterium]